MYKRITVQWVAVSWLMNIKEQTGNLALASSLKLAFCSSFEVTLK